MIELKTAVKIAKQIASDVFEPDNPRDMLLEGVDKDRQSGAWIITLSFLRIQSNPKRPSILGDTITGIASNIPREVRVFKRVEVDIESGEFLRISDYGSLEAAE